MSKDKYLDDMLAIDRLKDQEIAILLRLKADTGDVLAGIAVRAVLDVVSPSLTRHLEKFGLAPGKIVFPARR